MDAISNQKWQDLHERMATLGIYESDIEEQFVLGHGPGGQKLNNTHNVVHLIYKNHRIRVKKSRLRDANRFFARRDLCNRVSKELGVSNKDDEKLKKMIKQKKRRKKRSSKKYAPASPPPY